MMAGYLSQGKAGDTATFDLYYRHNPFNGGYAIAAGLEDAIHAVVDAKFSEDDIHFLRTLKSSTGARTCSDRFLNYLADYGFGGDIRAYLVLEGLALGHVYHRAVGVKRYRVTARTDGGHSWSDYGRPSAIHELAKLVVQLSSMDLPSHPRTTMNVGRISGGTSVNVIASEAVMDLDLRSEGQDSLARLVATADRLIQNASRQEVSVQAEVIGQRPAGQISPQHPLVRLGEECLRELGLNPVLTSGSTDANIPLSLGYPAVVLGVTTGGSAHTVHEFIHTEPVALGMEQLARFVTRAWK